MDEAAAVFPLTASGTDPQIGDSRLPMVEEAAPVARVHDLRVERLEDGSCRPCCSCGWSTTTYPSDDPHTAPVAAEDDCIEHALEVSDGWVVVP
ncbi:MAG: hypothetical protein ACRDZ4_07290 [Egibacteraceae bacterium]